MKLTHLRIAGAKGKLLQQYNYANLEDAKRELKLDTAKEVYTYLVNETNERERRAIAKKNNQIMMKTLRDKLRELRKNGKIPKETKLTQSYEQLKQVIANYELSKFNNIDMSVAKGVVTRGQAQSFATSLHDERFDFSGNGHGLNAVNYANGVIRKYLKQTNSGLKVTMSMILNIENREGDKTTFNLNRKSMQFTVLHESQINDAINVIRSSLPDIVSELEMRNTGWKFIGVKTLDIHIAKYRPIAGGSYIELDNYLKNKKCCINIKNNDDKCIMYCVLYHIYQNEIKKDPQRVSKYEQYLNVYDWSKIKFPATIREVEKIENLVDYGINVFSYDDGAVRPMRVTQRRDERIMNLLLIKNEQKVEHYVYISKLDVLVCGNKFNENGTHVASQKYVCPNCLHAYSSQELLLKHRTNGCDLFEPTRTVLPQPIKTENGGSFQPTIRFQNYTRKFKAPVVVYADFETIIEPIDVEHNNNVSSTSKTSHHTPCGYCFNVVSEFPQLNMGLKLYRGQDAATKFIHALLECSDKIKEILSVETPMVITPQQEREFAQCNTCHICDKRIKNSSEKVRDHCHITGLYRGCAHQDCNINFNYKNYRVPVYFHNLKGFDGHILIQALRELNFTNIRVIAQNFEKYMTLSFSNVQFLDSFAFLSSSLDKLSSNLLKDGIQNFYHTLKHSSHYNDEQKQLLFCKGVYPYEYMNSFEKFNETALPSIDKFYSSLNEDGISTEDYEHAQNVWNTFNIQNLGEFHDLYLKTDVLLLTDVFEAFRKTAMSGYGLDPCNNYITLPNFGWDAMLKKTQIKLEQITDVDMYMFCEKGLRGGISMISHRHARANNKYMKTYDPNVESSYITYLDANNLYGHAMIQSLPYANFEWVDSIPSCVGDDDEYGYIVECDLHYPQHLHDSHNNYPLAPEKLAVKQSQLSPYQINQMDKHNEKHCTIEKLVPNFQDKKNYVCHLRNLKFYEKMGLVVTQVHKVLKFKQSKWLKSYIDYNTQQRTKAKNDFEKDFYKLMNNAVFGKTMENMRARVKIDLYTDENLVLKQVAKPQYEDHQVYSENLVAIKQAPKQVELNKPIYVGLSVLDLSKLHMYQFHYEYIKPKYGDNVTLLFTDTDSLCYHVKCDDMYKDMHEDAHLFDQSEYHGDGYRVQNNFNKKVIGKFKDETEGTPIVEFCGLRSKMYSILLDNDKEKKTGKGIKKSTLKKTITHDDYKRCLFPTCIEDERQLVSFNNLRTYKHEIFGIRMTKVGLSCANDKQYLLDDGIASLSYGHYKIPARN